VMTGWRGAVGAGDEVMLQGGPSESEWRRWKVSKRTGDDVLLKKGREQAKASMRSANVALPPERRGISVAQLKQFVEDCNARCQQGGVVDPREFIVEPDGTPLRNPKFYSSLCFDEAPTWLVSDLFIKADTLAARVPYVDLLPDGGLGTVAIHVLHTSGGRFMDVVDAVLNHASDDSSVVWISCFALNLHRPEGVESSICSVASPPVQLLVVDPRTPPLQRLWVAWELYQGQATARAALHLWPPDLLERPDGIHFPPPAEVGRICKDWTAAESMMADFPEDSAVPMIQKAVLNAAKHLLISCVKFKGADSLQAAAAYEGYGTLMAEVGSWREAVDAFGTSLAIRERRLGRSHSLCGKTLLELGKAMSSAGDARLAKQKLEMALRIAEGREVGAVGVVGAAPGNVNVGRTLDALGVVYFALGMLDDAEGALTRAIAILEPKIGVDHEDAARAQLHLAQVLRARGRSKEAASRLSVAAAVLDARLGSDNPDTQQAASMSREAKRAAVEVSSPTASSDLAASRASLLRRSSQSSQQSRKKTPTCGCGPVSCTVM